jgi:hypothetical protein
MTGINKLQRPGGSGGGGKIYKFKSPQLKRLAHPKVSVGQKIDILQRFNERFANGEHPIEKAELKPAQDLLKNLVEEAKDLNNQQLENAAAITLENVNRQIGKEQPKTPPPPPPPPPLATPPEVAKGTPPKKSTPPPREIELIKKLEKTNDPEMVKTILKHLLAKKNFINPERISEAADRWAFDEDVEIKRLYLALIEKLPLDLPETAGSMLKKVPASTQGAETSSSGESLLIEAEEPPVPPSAVGTVIGDSASLAQAVEGAEKTETRHYEATDPNNPLAQAVLDEADRRQQAEQVVERQKEEIVEVSKLRRQLHMAEKGIKELEAVLEAEGLAYLIPGREIPAEERELFESTDDQVVLADVVAVDTAEADFEHDHRAVLMKRVASHLDRAIRNGNEELIQHYTLMIDTLNRSGSA